MRSPLRSPLRLLALLAALGLLLAACGEPEEAPEEVPDEVEDVEDDEEVADGGEFSMYLCEPERLLSQTSTEVCGSQVLEELFTGLVAYDPETSEIVDGGMATSITSEDQLTWTIELEEGWLFHNGEEVTADNFVNAWNWMADPVNEMDNAQFLATAGVEGYAEVAEGEAEELSGLTAVDDTTIEVTLEEPFGPFELLIGYTGFHPLPDAFFDMDVDEFEDAPIGNGPFMIDGTWERGQRIMLERFEDYGGPELARAERVELRIYDDVTTAYFDFEAGELDLHDNVPPELRAQAFADYPDSAFDNDVSTFEYVGFPVFAEPYDDVDLRRAISLAIDRQSIIDVIFDGSRTPARSVIPPILPAHRDDACEFCDFDPELAAELYAETAGVDEPLQLYFNSGAGHEEWMEAISLQLEEHLGISEVEFNSLEFAEYIPLLSAGEQEGPFRLGWVTIYPSPQYSMELYTSGSPSNFTGWDVPEFDELFAEANTLQPDEADPVYQQAEDVLLEDMPVVPLWYSVDTVVHGDGVRNVIANTRTFVEISKVEVVQ